MKTTTKIGIIAGEDIDMPREFIKENNIEMYTFNLNWEGVLKKQEDIYKKMRENRNNAQVGTPKTSQPSVGIFKELFEASLKKYDEVFVITLSSKLSGCYNSASQAVYLLSKKDKPRIHLIESLSSSSGSAFIVRELVDCVNKKMSVKEIKDTLSKVREEANVILMIEDSYWLQKGGRLSPAIAMIINQMKKINVRPLLGAKEGKIALLKVRTNIQDKVMGIFNHLDSEVGDKRAELIVTHADNSQEAQKLHKLLKEKKPKIKVLYINQLTPVLGAHVGPDTLVVGWRLV